MSLRASLSEKGHSFIRQFKPTNFLIEDKE